MTSRDDGSDMRFLVRLSGRIVVRGDDGMVLVDARDEMDRHLDDVMDQLIELDALDPSISLSDDSVEFSVVVFGSNPLVATETIRAI